MWLKRGFHILVTFKLQRVGTMNVLVMQDKKKCLMVILNLKIADSARFVNDNLCQRVFKWVGERTESL